jgi:hypothetical protein
MRYLLGIIFIGVGFLITWKANTVMSIFGRIGWAETHLGTEGGSRLFYRLLGLLIIILSFAYMSGCIEGFITSVILRK